MSDIRIGTSGWSCPHWRKAFYPSGLRQADELGYLAQRLRTAEINGSFYSLQRPDSYRRWGAATPDDFVFAVKGSRYITHMLRLSNVEQPLATLLASGMLALGGKLGPMLWQLPERMSFDAGRIRAFFDLLPRTHGAAAKLAAGCDRSRFDRWGTTAVTAAERPGRRLRHAVEPRHPSFDCGEFTELCRRYRVAVVLADSAGRWPRIQAPVTDLGYLRLHGSRQLYRGGYTDAELDDWAELLRRWIDRGVRTLRVYFDNDAAGHAPADAIRLAKRLGVATER